MVNLTVRPAEAPDIPTILAITQKAFQMYIMQLGEAVPLTALRETEEDIARDICEKHVLVGVANQMKIVGCVRYQLYGRLCYLSRLAVLPNWQQYGMGKHLVEAVREGSLALGATAIALHTATKLSKQVQFYYRQGFFIHSIAYNRGYARGLFLKELEPGTPLPDLAPVMQR